MLLFLFVPILNLLVDIIDNRICQLILRDNEDGEQQQGSRNDTYQPEYIISADTTWNDGFVSHTIEYDETVTMTNVGPTFTVDDKQEKTQYNLFFEEATAGFYFPVYRNIIWYTKRR